MDLLSISFKKRPICVPDLKEKEYQELQERTAGIEKATRLHLERKITDLAMQILGVRTVATSLSHRIRSVEDQNLKVRALGETCTAVWLEEPLIYVVFSPLKTPV